MIRHKYLRSTSLTVSEKYSSTKTLTIDKDGIVSEELTIDNQLELVKHPDFEAVDSGSKKEAVKEALPPPPAGKPDAGDADDETGKTDDPPAGEEGTEGKPDAAPNAPASDGPAEGDTKVEDGKAFLFKKNAAGKLTWMRDPANDPE